MIDLREDDLWDVTIRPSRAALARLADALIATNSRLIDSAIIGGRDGGAFVLRVEVDAKRLEFFKATCRPFRIERPPKASVCAQGGEGV